MRVKDCMCENVVWVGKDATVCDVAKLMNDNHVGSVPVCDENQNVIGIVTDRDIILRCKPNKSIRYNDNKRSKNIKGYRCKLGRKNNGTKPNS